MAASGERETGLQPVEILHIDTQGSGDFFERLETNESEKSACQALLQALFSSCCQEAGGYVSHWAGDGGFAFFSARLQTGGSIRAAQDFIAKLPVLAQQTATAVGRRLPAAEVHRRFRIQAHFALIYLGGDPGVTSGSRPGLDDFIKNERELAPVPDQLFITQQLRERLGSAEKQSFEPFIPERSYGTLRTAVYRRRSDPIHEARHVLGGGEFPRDMTESEWRYLRGHLLAQKLNVAARNTITTGLMHALADGVVTRAALTDLTMRALYNYLRVVYPHFSFHLALWRRSSDGSALEVAAAYPVDGPDLSRRVALADTRFQVVRAYLSELPVATPSVNAARVRGQWTDFEGQGEIPGRGYQSTLQIPVYRRKAHVEGLGKAMLAVLSVDSDRPDLFLEEELAIWEEDFVGFLVNFALAEQLK